MAKRRTSVSRQFRIIRSALSSIMGALDALAPALMASGAQERSASATPRRKLRLSPARRAALKVQGQYMGYLRGLKPREKARVKATRQARGVQAAVAMAKKLAA